MSAATLAAATLAAATAEAVPTVPVSDRRIYRPTALPIPARLRTRPVVRGYPVPWFVAEVGGQYDFRIMEPAKLRIAWEDRRCWMCGGALGRYVVFVVGPMCAINRTSSEPPSHRDCAEYAARVCPFLAQHEHTRRTVGLPEDIAPPAGIMIARQPGVTLLWVTTRYAPFPTDDGQGNAGVLFEMGEPTELVWLREGRPATRAEVVGSLVTGYPLLEQLAREEGPEALAELERRRAWVEARLPAREGKEGVA